MRTHRFYVETLDGEKPTGKEKQFHYKNVSLSSAVTANASLKTLKNIDECEKNSSPKMGTPPAFRVRQCIVQIAYSSNSILM